MFQNERLPGAGCVPLSSISCKHANHHKLIPLNNISYFSYSSFLKLAVPVYSENDCKQSCLTNRSCKVVIFNSDIGAGSCLLLSEQMLILFADNSSNHFSAFVKIQDNLPEKRRAIIIVCSTVAGFSLISVLVCAVIWNKCKKDKEPLFDGIPGIPKCFSFDELKVATRYKAGTWWFRISLQRHDRERNHCCQTLGGCRTRNRRVLGRGQDDW